jgi:hypothetical protein
VLYVVMKELLNVDMQQSMVDLFVIQMTIELLIVMLCILFMDIDFKMWGNK